MLWLLLVLVLYVCYKLGEWALAHVHYGNHRDKYVLITGCDSGFGNMLAKRLDGLGFHVFASCLSPGEADRLLGECSEHVIPFVLNIVDQESIAHARQFVNSRLPAGTGLWGLVNNAGITGSIGPTEWLTKDDWMQVLNVNLLGVINITRQFLPLVRTARGRIVNMSSTVGRIALSPGPYTVSKFGVEAFSDCLRREVYAQGIKVCILEPGYFKTDIMGIERLIENFRKRYDSTPDNLRSCYPLYTMEGFSKLAVLTRERSSDNLDLVVNAYELALTSRFPPTRQQIGYDVNIVFRLLWNLPDCLSDFLIHHAMQHAIKKASDHQTTTPEAAAN